MHIFLFFILFCFFPVATQAADSDNPWISTLYFENDLFVGSDSDYTNGIKYSIISPDLSPTAPHRKTAQIPMVLLDFVQSLPLIRNSAEETDHKLELAIGQNMYTPRDISRFDLIRDDRPYAGYLYVSSSFHRRSDLGQLQSQMDTLEVQFGMVGPSSLAEDAQKLVHQVRGFQRPNGWDHQLKDEPGLNLIFERKWLFHPNNDGQFGADAILHAGAALGNVMTYANAGFEVRGGWNVPRSFGVSLIRPAGSTWNNDDSGLSLYLFGAVNGKAVALDIFLDGNNFRNSHSVKKEPLVADISTGVTMSYEKLTVSLAQNIRTREFRQQQKYHSFASLVFSYAF
jgi:hypothetical protein